MKSSSSSLTIVLILRFPDIARTRQQLTPSTPSTPITFVEGTFFKKKRKRKKRKKKVRLRKYQELFCFKLRKGFNNSLPIK